MPVTVDPYSAFLNVPYDSEFESVYLAYIAGLAAFGLKARTTLEIPGGARRLDRIFQLIQTCRYSLHDLSRVELNVRRPATPRFNMPFELGLAVACERMSRKGTHLWFVFESTRRRIYKSLSDLGGTDEHVHGGSVSGVLRELGNALVQSRRRPTMQQMFRVYREVEGSLPEVRSRTGSRSLFEARVFRDLVLLARLSADRHVR